MAPTNSSSSSRAVSVSSSGNASLTDLVDLQDEHHSVRQGQLVDVKKPGSLSNKFFSRLISSGLEYMKLAANSSSSQYFSSQDLLKSILPSGGLFCHS